MGPPQAEAALREALSIGIDRRFYYPAALSQASDTWATSYVLSKAIEKISNVDMVICGKQASDGDTAQVGPGIATHINLPQATYVRKVDNVDLEKKVIRLERLLEDGIEKIEVSMPLLMTVVKEINTPRLPSLRGKMRANSQAVTT